MITTFDLIYYAAYILCLYFSFRAGEDSVPGLPLLRFMLCFGIGTEAAVEVLQFLKKEENPPYYFYIPVEYYCLIQFYKANTGHIALQKYLNASVPVYFGAALVLTFFQYRFIGYPSLIYNISCLFNSIWISLLLFNFNMGDPKQIWRHPLFIILSAFLIFFSGVFFFNMTYSYLLKQDSELAKSLRTYTNIFLNDILYILLAYGFICSAKNRK